MLSKEVIQEIILVDKQISMPASMQPKLIMSNINTYTMLSSTCTWSRSVYLLPLIITFFFRTHSIPSSFQIDQKIAKQQNNTKIDGKLDCKFTWNKFKFSCFLFLLLFLFLFLFGVFCATILSVIGGHKPKAI